MAIFCWLLGETVALKIATFTVCGLFCALSAEIGTTRDNLRDTFGNGRKSAVLFLLLIFWRPDMVIVGLLGAEATQNKLNTFGNYLEGGDSVQEPMVTWHSSSQTCMHKNKTHEGPKKSTTNKLGFE